MNDELKDFLELLTPQYRIFLANIVRKIEEIKQEKVLHYEARYEA